MTSGSLRIRLLAAAALSILAALLLIGFLLVGVFDQYVRSRMGSDLGHHLDQLAALSAPDQAQGLKIEGELTDPRFDQPLSGLYWQVDRDGRSIARSRSLWDETLALDDTSQTSGSIIVTEVEGPAGARLLAASRIVTVASGTFHLTVANDLKELALGRRGLVKTLAAGLSFAFLGLLIASWLQVSFGLRPLDHIRVELQRIRGGKAARMDSTRLPDEVRPLAFEVNRFLDAQEEAGNRARRRAGDLAHGLKTPLASVAAEADRLRRDGHADASKTLMRHVEAMRRHVERHLAMARSVGSRSTVGLATTGPVGVRLASIIDVLQKLPRDRELAWSVEGETSSCVRMDGEDFDEVFGNLLDNARKWARSRVAVAVFESGEHLEIVVADDGPGIPEPHMAAALERGKRLDERVHGSGLGLSIVDAVLEGYGADLKLARSEHLGGLEVRVRLARA